MKYRACAVEYCGRGGARPTTTLPHLVYWFYCLTTKSDNRHKYLTARTERPHNLLVVLLEPDVRINAV